MLRDKQDEFISFYSNLPELWRVLVTSRVRVDGATTLPLTDLRDADAEHLARRYAQSRSEILPNDIVKRVARSAKNNPLAIKLTVDSIVRGYDLSESTARIEVEAAQFSYDNLIEALSDSAVKILEVLFVSESCVRADLMAILEQDADAIADALRDLLDTSLVSRGFGESADCYYLNESVRYLLRVSPKNLRFRNEVESLARKRRQLLDQHLHHHDASSHVEFSVDFVPNSAPTALRELVHSANACVKKSKKSVKSVISGASVLIPRFKMFESEFEGVYFYWLAYGRVMQACGDLRAAETCYRRAITIDANLPQAFILCAWLCVRENRHKEAMDLYRALIEKGWSNAENSGYQTARFIKEGILKSALFGARYSDLLELTSAWADECGYEEFYGGFRIAALRQIECFGEAKMQYLSEALDIVDSICRRDTAPSEHFGRHCYKLFQDICHHAKRDISNDLLNRFMTSIAGHFVKLSKLFLIEEIHNLGLAAILDEADRRSCADAERAREALRSIIGVSSEKKEHFERFGYKFVVVDRIPTAAGSVGQFLFAKDDEGEQFFVHRNSFDGDYSEWVRLRPGSRLMINPMHATGEYRKSQETLILN